MNIDPEDRLFIQRLTEIYAPEPLSDAQRAAFDARLRERLEESHRPRRLVLAFTSLSVAVAFAWAVFSFAPSALREDHAHDALARATPEWERNVFYGEATESGAGSALPPDYEAIDSLFFGG